MVWFAATSLVVAYKSGLSSVTRRSSRCDEAIEV